MAIEKFSDSNPQELAHPELVSDASFEVWLRVLEDKYQRPLSTPELNREFNTHLRRSRRSELAAPRFIDRVTQPVKEKLSHGGLTVQYHIVIKDISIGEQVITGLAPGDEEVLAYLISKKGCPVNTRDILEECWPEPSKYNLNTAYQSIYRIRQIIGVNNIEKLSQAGYYIPPLHPSYVRTLVSTFTH